MDPQGAADRPDALPAQGRAAYALPFRGHGDGYRLGCGEGRTVPGPYTQEFYTWMEVDDWPAWERQLI